MNHQKENIKKLFKERANTWIPLPDIMKFAAQYNTRILELRRSGMKIKNRKERIGGQTLSWFKYIPPETKQEELF